MSAKRFVKTAATIAAVTVAVMVIRGAALYTPYADPTVGLYLLIGDAWRHGQLPYVTLWDYRPPGFFALYALGLAMFGSGLARDALATVSLVATAFAVREIAARLTGSLRESCGWFALLFFVLLSPVNDGITGAAELQINACIAWSVAFALRKPSSPNVALAGLLAGLAIECKLSACALMVLPFALTALRRRSLGSSALFIAGVALPTLVVTAIYAVAQKLPLLYDANISATIRRSEMIDTAGEFARNRIWLVRQVWALAPDLELGGLVLFTGNRKAQGICGAWLLLSVLSIAFVGEWYERQFVLLAPPVAIAAAIGLTWLSDRMSSHVAFRRWLIGSIFVASFLIQDYHDVAVGSGYALHRGVLREAAWHADQSEEVYRCLHPVMIPHASLLLLEQNPFLYERLHAGLPTRYPYSDTLLDPRLSRSAGIDGYAELQRMFSHDPTFVVTSSLRDYRYDPRRVALIRTELHAYDPICTGANFTVYQSKR